ncbi:MarR family transcriptional regulator [Burkholderia gladioli]|uniref:MarR family transcriptional regulator n=1 Tax=Burkholderia gladioli TaxID=28095 RepID=UPI0015E31CEB|nr:MarR family transcriptional regulator [Burkholderia gladioli]
MPTQLQIAEHLDLDQSAVSRFVDKIGLDYRDATIDDVRLAYIRHLREMAAGRGSNGGLDLVAERAKTEIVERELKLLALAEKKRELVNAQQLERVYGEMVTAFQIELLAFPDSLAQELRTLYGVDVDVEWLNEHIYGFLEQLSRYESDGERRDSSTGSATSTAGEDWYDGVGEQTSSDECESSGETRAL